MGSAMTVEHLLERNEAERLRERYGDYLERHVRLRVGPGLMSRFGKRKLSKRRGEVVLLLQRGDGRVLLHTKHKYPAGAYRLPTGGVEWGETVWDAFRREAYEETGWRIKGGRLVGLVTYEFKCEGRVSPFASWVFHAAGVVGEPKPRDEDEGISGFKWLHRGWLGAVAASLRRLPKDRGDTADWGRFRAVVHEVAAELEL